jgi:hypothetical protein
VLNLARGDRFDRREARAEQGKREADGGAELGASANSTRRSMAAAWVTLRQH